MLRSSIVTFWLGDEPRTESGELEPGYVVAGIVPATLDLEYPQDRIVLHVEPGKPVPGDALQVIVDGSVAEWRPAEVAAAWPNGSKYVMEATWQELDLEGLLALKRGKVADVELLGVTIQEADLIPHLWAGEEP